MVNVTIVTPMRDCADILTEYLLRVNTLEWPQDRLRIVVSESDSIDRTEVYLEDWAARDPRVTVVTRATGARKFGSVVDPERFRILAEAFNAGLEAVDLVWSDYVLFLPADILFRSDLLQRLVGLADLMSLDILSPFVWMNGQFYDVWAFSRGGANFPPFRYHVAETFKPGPVEMETVGGVMLIDAKVLRAGVRYTVEEVDRGFCKQARALGFGVYADPTTDVWHPLPV